MPGTVQVGDRVADRFEVFEIHQGGMGMVYAAWDQRGAPGRERVALKTLRQELLVDQDRGRRFLAECRLWVRLGRHPNVVQAYAVEEIEGRPHIVLELVTGGELRKRIGSSRLELPQALKLGVEFCLGMEHAIRQGLRCHRDIKPGNLLMTDDGTLKITDFGLASVRDELLAVGLELPDDPIPLAEPETSRPIIWSDPRDHVERPSPSSTPHPRSLTPDPGPDPPPLPSPSRIEPAGAAIPLRPDTMEIDSRGSESTLIYSSPRRPDASETVIATMTRTGALLGTLPYMAPEQFRNAHTVDVRSDIYSFGVVLFELVTSKLPFQARTVAAIERQHTLLEAPSVISAIPPRFTRIAQDVDALIHHCLAKDPADRFATIPDLRRSLSGIIRRLGSV
jgi:serine/threonine protein kinase